MTRLSKDGMRTSTLDNVKEGGILSRPLEWWRDGLDFLSKVREELKRVTWPSRKEVYATTLVVILVSVFFAVYLAAVDMVLNYVVTWIFRQAGVS
ncbi:MAG TPA: preprotein translocase subunit SecE [Thermoanaerobaculia bacterium]|nr:preprotein translocase subunit SecE [Thermoanaerobaculia bacterium]